MQIIEIGDGLRQMRHTNGEFTWTQLGAKIRNRQHTKYTSPKETPGARQYTTPSSLVVTLDE